MVAIAESDTEIVCSFSGRLDAAAMQRDEPAVEETVRQAAGRPVVFDLGSVTFVASSFLRLCVRTPRLLAGTGEFSLRNLPPEVKKVFVIAGLDRQLHIA
jgi:anti-anti-sigma factor